jgi:uncharacterized protein (TIGR00299 family) protein
MYIECRAGAAGDMLLGAWLDAGLPVSELESALGSLRVNHELVVHRVSRAGIAATKVDVRELAPVAASSAEAPGHADHRHPHEHDAHRSLHHINQVIRGSALSPTGKSRAVALFRRLAEAEATIHGIPVEDVHFHEVGALDSIIDIVGTVFALDWFGISDIVVSPLNVGGGTVQIAHGRFPVPAPATLALLTGVPIYNGGPDVELVTPTGALLLTGYATAFGDMPAMAVERVGYGAGTRDFADVPNVLRVAIGERTGQSETASDSVVKIECEVDDMNPQLFSPATERLFAAGALDVFVTAIQMKKGRPGHLVTVLVPPEKRRTVCDVLFAETTTIGLRYETMARETLSRRWETVQVWGLDVRIKIAERDGHTFNAAPEFDDCVAVADRLGRPVKQAQAEALRIWWSRAG